MNPYGKLIVDNPTQNEDWNDRIAKCKWATFFHTANWATVLEKTHHYTPFYFSLYQNETMSYLLPIMEVKSLITGCRGVSLPFTDRCSLLPKDNKARKMLLDNIEEFASSRKWKYIELKETMMRRLGAAEI